jgi:hypothetical protein
VIARAGIGEAIDSHGFEWLVGDLRGLLTAEAPA